MSNIQNGFEFDWDSAIEKDGEEFVLLPEGKYDFEVTGFERQRYTPAQTAVCRHARWRCSNCASAVNWGRQQ